MTRWQRATINNSFGQKWIFKIRNRFTSYVDRVYNLWYDGTWVVEVEKKKKKKENTGPFFERPLNVSFDDKKPSLTSVDKN